MTVRVAPWSYWPMSRAQRPGGGGQATGLGLGVCRVCVGSSWPPIWAVWSSLREKALGIRFAQPRPACPLAGTKESLGIHSQLLLVLPRASGWASFHSRDSQHRGRPPPLTNSEASARDNLFPSEELRRAACLGPSSCSGMFLTPFCGAGAKQRLRPAVPLQPRSPSVATDMAPEALARLLPLCALPPSRASTILAGSAPPAPNPQGQFRGRFLTVPWQF